MAKKDDHGVKVIQGRSEIEEVATSVAGFIGLAEKGPLNEAKLIQKFEEFEETFGGYIELGRLAYSIAGFFQNGGKRCYVVRIEPEHVGSEEVKAGLSVLTEIEEVSLIAIPDAADILEVIQVGLEYCEKRGNCFFIADPPTGTEPSEIIEFLNKIESLSSYGAIYYPNIYVEDPITEEKKLIPPSGHIAGVYVRTDMNRGIWKAPAGTNGELLGAVDLEREITQGDQELLNPKGINVIKKFADRGIIVWGGQTLTSEDPEYKYISSRRFVSHIEKSIFIGTLWATFEPNNELLWAKLRSSIKTFLTKIWRDGALQGSRPQEAFFVYCGETTNTRKTIAEGKIIIEIGLALMRPAEFIRIKITQIVKKSE